LLLARSRTLQQGNSLRGESAVNDIDGQPEGASVWDNASQCEELTAIFVTILKGGKCLNGKPGRCCASVTASFILLPFVWRDVLRLTRDVRILRSHDLPFPGAFEPRVGPDQTTLCLLAILEQSNLNSQPSTLSGAG
jgi:hypothetical protein